MIAVADPRGDPREQRNPPFAFSNLQSFTVMLLNLLMNVVHSRTNKSKLKAVAASIYTDRVQ